MDALVKLSAQLLKVAERIQAEPPADIRILHAGFCVTRAADLQTACDKVGTLEAAGYTDLLIDTTLDGKNFHTYTPARVRTFLQEGRENGQ